MITLTLTFLPSAIPWALSAFIVMNYLIQNSHSKNLSSYIIVLLIPFISISFYLIFTFIIYLILPPLEKGQYTLGPNKETLTWYMHLALNRSSKILGMRYLINSFFIFKYLHLRSLGAKISFDLKTSLDYVFADLPLIKIGKNCTIGHNVYISCHLINGNQLILLPVEMGDGVKIAMNCTIGPGTRIGNNCTIDFENHIYGVRLKQDTHIKAHQWMHGPPSKQHSEKAKSSY